MTVSGRLKQLISILDSRCVSIFHKERKLETLQLDMCSSSLSLLLNLKILPRITDFGKHFWGLLIVIKMLAHLTKPYRQIGGQSQTLVDCTTELEVWLHTQREQGVVSVELVLLSQMTVFVTLRPQWPMGHRSSLFI